MRRIQDLVSVLSVLSVLSILPPLPSATLTVDLDGDGDYPDIQSAIDDAEAGDTVLVRPGEYVISEPLTMRGKGITLKGEEGPLTTVVRMSIAPVNPRRASVMVFEDGEGEDSVVENLTFTGGTGSDLCLDACYLVGGGLFFRGMVAPKLVRCIVTRNYCAVAGGGASCYNGSSPTFRECTFSLNATAGHAGAIFLYMSCSPRLIGCTLARNVALGGMGGAVRCWMSCSPHCSDCTFEGNSVQGGQWGGQGAALKCDNGSNPILERCSIRGNWAEKLGSAVFLYHSTGTLTDCLVYGNRAGEAGAIASHEQGLAVATNCTVAYNSGSWGGCFDSVNGGTATLKNCIAWGNSPNTVSGTTSFCTIAEDPLFGSPGSYDFWQFEVEEIQGVQYQIPAFVVEEPDFRLEPDSPCIDAGTSEGASTADFEGNPRPCGDGVDIGAFELQDSLPPTERFQRADANDDGTTDMSDAIVILGFLFLGSAMNDCEDAADVNDDGEVNISDPIALLGHLFLGSEPPEDPFGICGTDPTADGLDCKAFSRCP